MKGTNSLNLKLAMTTVALMLQPTLSFANTSGSKVAPFVFGGSDVEENNDIAKTTVGLVGILPDDPDTGKPSGAYVCSGTLIDENIILTAAHCVTAQKIAILFGPN